MSKQLVQLEMREYWYGPDARNELIIEDMAERSVPEVVHETSDRVPFQERKHEDRTVRLTGHLHAEDVAVRDLECGLSAMTEIKIRSTGFISVLNNLPTTETIHHETR